MSDDEDDAPTTPQAPRPLTLFAAAGWSLAAKLLFIWLVMVVVSLKHAAKDDLVTLFGCQVVGYLLPVFFILRVHAPEASIRDFLGVRATSFLFVPLATLLGLAIDPPVSKIYEAIVARWPTEPDDLPALYQEASSGKRVVIFLILCLLGPALEEAFFRGALFQTIKRHKLPAVILALGVFFAFAHEQWQMWLPIAIVGAAMAFVRASSGSVLPSFFFHAAFNGTAFYQLAKGISDDAPTPWPRVAIGVTATIALLAACALVGSRSRVAQIAREMDKL